MPLKIKIEDMFWVGNCLIVVGIRLKGKLDWNIKVNIIAPTMIGGKEEEVFEDEIIGFETNPNNDRDVAVYLLKATKDDICKGSEILQAPYTMVY